MRAPFGLFLWRIVVGVGVLSLLAMLYWSNHLIEEEVKELRGELQQLQWQGIVRVSQTRVATDRPHIDPALPNLLIEDPFYRTTLPEILGPNFQPQGKFRYAELGKPHNLHPFTNWAAVSRLTDLCRGKVGRLHFGKYEQFGPDMAKKVEERAPGEFWVHLRDDIFWEPLEPRFFPENFPLDARFFERHPVVASDFKFWVDAIMNPYVAEGGPLRNYLRDIEEFRVIDDQTFVVRWRTHEYPDGTRKAKYIARTWTMALTPLAGWVYQYFADGTKIIEDETDQTYRTNSIWAQNFAHHWAHNVVVSCGPWMFDGWTGRELRLKRNQRYHEPFAALATGIIFSFKESIDAIWNDFKAGDIDVYESRIAPEKLRELESFTHSTTYQRQAEQGAKIERLDYIDRAYRYVGWNTTRPFFQSNKVRQAMTLAIDRRRIITQNLQDMGIEITGPLFPNDPDYDPTLQALPFDPLAARRLLEAEGWYDLDGDGIREKEIDGKVVKFQFRLVYYVGSVTARTTCDYIASALKEVGVECTPLSLDVADLSAATESKDFDALYLAWMLGAPPSNPRQLWHSSGAQEKGSSNHIGYVNLEVDQIIEELDYEYDSEKRQELYRRFHRIVADDQPYTFLVVPRIAFLYRSYLGNVFIPASRQDLVPGAVVTEPDSRIFWLR